MKKLIVLSVLLALASFPLMASDVTFSGDVTYGFISDFGDSFAEDTTATIDVNAAVDDYNSTVVSVKNVTGTIVLDQATIETDLGAAFGLTDMGVGLVLTAGYFDTGDEEYVIQSGYENENVMGIGTAKAWELSTVLTVMDMVNIKFAVDPAMPLGTLIAGAYGEFGPVKAEVFYDLDAGAEAADGKIGIDGSYAMDIADLSLGVGLGFMYDMSVTDGAAAKQWAYGLGLGVGWTEMISLGVGVDGNSMDAFNGLTANVGIDPIDLVGLYAGMVLSFAEGADAFQEADLGIVVHPGAAEIYIGYLVTSVGSGGDLNAPTSLPDGGGYLKVDIDY